ncbi:MAG: DUF4416 family protein [Nitrospirota bacterium]
MKKTASSPSPVKLFIGMISQDVSLFKELKDKLQNIYGPSDMESPVCRWENTDYYSKEMGKGLKRQFIFFQELISPALIPEIKLKTMELERKYLNEENPPLHPFSKNPPIPPLTKGGKGGFKGGRKINLDPGYLDSARIILVSSKDFSHRIYLGKGIYGEVTLIYSGNNYQVLPYTYPDFRTQKYWDIFKKARELYKKINQLKT